MGKQCIQWQTIFLVSKTTADGDCSHEIKRCLLLGRKAMANLNIILKSRNITLLKNVHLVKAMVFPVVMYGCKSWTIKKAEHWRIYAFELQCWTRLLTVPWTARRSNQSILKEISPEDSWKDWCWSLNSNTLATWGEELTYWKRPRCWERLKAGGEGDDRRWEGWMASLPWWTWIWVSSGSWWWTWKPGVLQSMESQRVRQDWGTELHWRLWLCGSGQTVEYSSRAGNTRPPYLPPEKLDYMLRSIVKNGHEQQTGSNLGKVYFKFVHCHSAYLTLIQSTSCEMPGWMKHKVESRL